MKRDARGLELSTDSVQAALLFDRGLDALASLSAAHLVTSAHRARKQNRRRCPEVPGPTKLLSNRAGEWREFISPTPAVSAEDTFKLYDTYGFPLDLTELVARERGLTVDVAGFERLMDEQRERARKARKSKRHCAARRPGEHARPGGAMRMRAGHLQP